MLERLKKLFKKDKEDFKIDRNLIKISSDTNVIRIEINDYISIIDYVDTMKVIDINKRVQISNNILWNTDRQSVDKGVYYVISINNKIYNIKINEQHTEIDERTYYSNGEVLERILDIKNDGAYYYSLLKHDKTGSTYGTYFYNNVREVWIPKFQLSKDDAFVEIWEMLSGLKEVQNIDTIIDIDVLSKNILESEENCVIKRVKK